METHSRGVKETRRHHSRTRAHGVDNRLSNQRNRCTMGDNRGGTQEVNAALTLPQNLTSDSSKYLEYPASKPFINSDYTVAKKGLDIHPISNRDAIITALRNLQDKIKDLEIERTTAEKKLQSLASQSGLHKPGLESRKPALGQRLHHDKQADDHGDVFLSQTKELEGQLTSSERRCQSLEEQLGQMRRMVESTERNQRNLLEQVGQRQQGKDVNGAEVKQHMDRLNELEKDQKRLTATQTIAESKIRELEEKIKVENIHRRTLQDKTQQLESEALRKKGSDSYQVPSIPSPKVLKTRPMTVLKTKKPTKKKKKTVHETAETSRGQATRHYRLNLAEIPFVAGKSTGPSHSLGANVQKVLAMMKRHNSALCSHLPAPNGDSRRPGSGGSSSSSSSLADSSSSGRLDQDLSDLMMQLQDEFGHLCSKHQDLVDQLALTKDYSAKKILEEDLDILVQSMKLKSQQISRIRQHLSKVEEAKKGKPLPVKRREKRPQSAPAKQNEHHISHKARPKPHSCNKPIGHSALGKPALFMLRDMKTLQKTLRKDDDLCWE